MKVEGVVTHTPRYSALLKRSGVNQICTDIRIKWQRKVTGSKTLTPTACQTNLACVTGLVSLALDAQVHDMVTADSTVVYHYVPRPQSYGVPLFN